MRTLMVVIMMTVVLGSGCSRKQEQPVSQQSTAPKGAPVTPAATATPAAQPRAVASVATNTRRPFVSCNGKLTNMVYLAGDFEKINMMFSGESVSLEDVERECAVATNNADLWLLRGVMSRGNTSNQIACIRNAARLAPDAILPLITLAQLLSREKQTGEARLLITSVFERVTSPEQIQIWIQSAAMMAMEREESRRFPARPEGDWLNDFIVARTNSIQAKYAGMMLTFFKPDQDPAKAVEAARAVFAASNDQFRAAAVSVLFAMKQQARYGADDDEKPATGLDELLDAYATPYEKAMVKMTGMTRSERRSKGVAACRDAIKLATNAEMRIVAVFPLIEDMDLLKRDSTNMETLIVEAMGADGWNSRYASAIVTAAGQNGNTAMVMRLLAASERYVTNDPSFALGVIAGCTKYDDNARLNSFELGMADRIRSRFPTNESVLRALVAMYEGGGLLDDAIACRTTLIAQVSSTSRKAGEVAELIASMVKHKELDAVQPLVDQHRSLATSNSSLAIAVSQYMLTTGRTNEAGSFLLACYGTIPGNRDRAWLLSNLLERRRYDSATLTEAIAKARDLVRSDDETARWLGSEVFSAMVKLKDYDEALAFAGEQLRKGEVFYSISQLRDAPGGKERLTAFVQKWLQEGGSTQRNVNVAMASLCQECGLENQALELHLHELRTCTAAYEVVMTASELLQSADSVGDKKKIEEVIGVMDKAMADPGANLKWLQGLQWALKRAGCDDRADAWFDQIWQRATNKTDIAFEAASFCMERDRTGMVKEIIAIIAGEAPLPLVRQWQLNSLYAFTGDKEAAARVRAVLKGSLTNEQMILRYGGRYLDLLDDERDKGIEGAEEEMRSLALEWIRNQDIAMYQRLQFCDQLKGRKDATLRIEMLEQLQKEAGNKHERRSVESTLMDEYLKSHNTGGFFRIAEALRSRSDTEGYMLDQLAGNFEKLGMYAEALVLIEQQNDQDGESDSRKLKKKAELYIKLADKDQALACIDEAISKIDKDSSSSYETLTIARLCRKAGKPEKGLALLNAAFEECTEAEAATTMTRNIMDYAREAEIEFDGEIITATLLALERSTETLKIAAGCAHRMGNMPKAKEYLLEALAKASDQNQRRGLNGLGFTIARNSGDNALMVDVLQQDLDLNGDDGERGHTQSQMVEALVKLGDAEKAVQKGNEYLATAAQNKIKASEYDEIREQLVTALNTTGDKDGAWQVAQQIADTQKYLAAANALGKMDDAVKRLEEDFDATDAKKKAAALDALMGVYRRASNTAAIASLAERAASCTGGLTPDDAAVFSRALAAGGKKEQAADLLKKVYATANRYQKEQADANIAMFLAEAGQFKEAMAWLDAKPQEPPILTLKSMLLARQGNTADAVRVCCDAIDSIPAGDDDDVNGCFDTLKTIMGTTQDKDMVDTAVARLMSAGNMHDATLHASVAELYNHAKRYEESLKEYEKAAALAIDEDTKREYLGKCAHGSLLAGDADKAIEAYRALLDDKSLNWNARDDLRVQIAGVYEKCNKPKNAGDVYHEDIRDCEEHIRKMSKCRDTINEQFRLAELYTKVGETGETTRVLKKIADDRPGTSHATRANETLKKMNAPVANPGR